MNPAPGVINKATQAVGKAGQVVDKLKSATTGNPFVMKIVKLLLILALISLIIYALIFAFQTKQDLATPDNISRTATLQLAHMQKLYASTQGKKGIETVFSSIPDDQRLLINTSVLSTRLAGYLGPFDSGVFSEDNATRMALSTGSRCIIIEIDHEETSFDPKLIYRDGGGIKRSLNMGSIGLVAKSIAGRAFTPSADSVPGQLANNPLFVVLYFARAPSMATRQREYIKYLAQVAEQLQPLKDYLVGQTPQGDFRRQQLESQLFYMPYTIFSKQIILMTNADTTPFRRLDALGMTGEINMNNDLDLMTHVRLYSKESPSGLGITQVPSTNIAPSAVITRPYYWLAMPPDRLLEAQGQTKKAWTLVMEPVANETNTPNKSNLNRLLNEFGVQSVPYCLFDKKESVEAYGGITGAYRTTAWITKPELIRYIPPKPLVIQKASPKTNSNGGAIFSPLL
jgi:hypothetical protein